MPGTPKKVARKNAGDFIKSGRNFSGILHLTSMVFDIHASMIYGFTYFCQPSFFHGQI